MTVDSLSLEIIRCQELVDLDCTGGWQLGRMNSVDEMTMKTLHLIDQVMCDCRFTVLRNNNVSTLKKGFKLFFCRKNLKIMNLSQNNFAWSSQLMGY